MAVETGSRMEKHRDGRCRGLRCVEKGNQKQERAAVKHPPVAVAIKDAPEEGSSSESRRRVVPPGYEWPIEAQRRGALFSKSVQKKW